MYICCLIQDGEAPLQVAIKMNANDVVYLLMINHNQQTSHLSQVKIIIILCIMIATVTASNYVALTSLPINSCCSDSIMYVYNSKIYSFKHTYIFITYASYLSCIEVTNTYIHRLIKSVKHRDSQQQF